MLMIRIPLGWTWPGLAAMGLIVITLGAAGIGLAGNIDGVSLGAIVEDEYIRHVLWFTVWQALLSTALSVGLAIPVARALHRRTRRLNPAWIQAFAGLAFVLPSIVAIFGIVSVHGRTGYANQVMEWFGAQGGHYLYGLTGILIAHTFFNLPLAARVLLQGLADIPAENWRNASQFGLRSADLFRIVEWPVLRGLLAGVSGMVFLLCFTSFAVVLALGGGPGATTLEVAIYQSLRVDYDLELAVGLSLLQIASCLSIFFIISRLGKVVEVTTTLGQALERPDVHERGSRWLDFAVLGLALVWIGTPLAAVLVDGMKHFHLAFLWDPAVQQAIIGTLAVSLPAAVIATTLGLAIAYLVKHHRLGKRRSTVADTAEAVGSAVLVVPPLVLGTGLFLFFHDIADVFAIAPAIVVTVNALIALPFAIRILVPSVIHISQQTDKLCASLGVHGYARFKTVTWPCLHAGVGFTLAVTAALSAGDLSVIALFGTQDFNTLPMLIYRLMGAYRMDQAAVAALMLCATCITLFVGFDRLSRHVKFG